MASIWDKFITPTVGGKISGSVWDKTNLPFADIPTTETLENITKYEDDLRRAGIEPPKMKKVLGTVNKILDVIRSGEYAVGKTLAKITGKEFPEEEHISPSEVFGIIPKETKSIWGLLKQPAFYGALAVDVLLDPITYLTFGFGGGVKIFTKIGAKTLNQGGTKLLTKASVQFGEDAARRMMATAILREGGEKYLAKGGLKWMGIEVLPKNVVQAPFKRIDWALERVPFTGIAYKTVKKTLDEAFRPMADINRLPFDKGGNGKFEEMIFKTQKGIRGETKREMERIATLGKEAEKAGLKDPGKQIMAAIEFDVKSGNKVLDDIADWMSQSLEVYSRAELKRGILGAKVPNYMRHFLTEEGREFLEKKGAMVQQEFINNIRHFRVRAPFAAERKLKDAVVNINNLYKEKYGIKLFEEDAFKAFTQRTFEHVKSVRMYDMFKTLVDERIAIPAKVEAKLVKQIGKPLKTIRKTVETDMIDGIKYVQTKIPQLEGYLVPEQVGKYLDQTYSFLTNDEVAKGVLGLYDKLFRYWKLTVTGLWPAFHTRNFLGGVFNNWLAGIWNPKWYKWADEIVRGKEGKIVSKVTGKIYTYNEIRRLIEDLGVTGMPGMVDVMQNLEEMIKIGKVARAKNIINYPRVAMETVEDRLRTPLFINRLAKGDTPEEAARWVFRFQFDYAPEAFTPFETNVIRRLIPFYTWTRGNVPLQVEQLLKQPGKYAGLEKFRQLFTKASGEEAIDEKEYLPEWMKEMFVFRLPGESKKGLPRYLQLDLPMEDLNKLPFTESGRREILSLLSPFLKYPIEVIANRNLYFGSEIYRADMPKEYQTAKAIEVLKQLPQPLKDYLNFKEGVRKNTRTGEFEPYYEMDAIKLHAIRSVLMGRFYSTVAQSTDSEIEAWMKLSRVLGGIPVRPVDIEEEKYNRLKQQESILRNMETYLKQRGIMEYKTKQAQPKKVGGSVWDNLIK